MRKQLILRSRTGAASAAGLALLFLFFLFDLAGLAASTGPVREIDKTGMVLIKGGVFTMGGVGPRARGDELPAHKVEVKSFYLDRHEVTNEEFGRFVEATGYKTTAEKFIDWESMKQDLPPGAKKPPSTYLGRVRQSEAKQPILNPTGPINGYDRRHPGQKNVRVVRGGSYLCHDSYCESYRPSGRMSCPEDTSMPHIGFRCALDLEPAPTRERYSGTKNEEDSQVK